MFDDILYKTFYEKVLLFAFYYLLIYNEIKEVSYMKIDDVIMALEFVSSGIDSRVYYNPKLKKFDYDSDFDCEFDEKYEQDYIMLPTKYDINEYSMMEDFIETVDNTKIHNELSNAIRGRGAFRRFKDICNYYNIGDKWYKFRDKKYKELAREWCFENNIDFEE